MGPFETVEDAVRAVREYQGRPEDFELAIADSMNDAVGINMAIVGDAILKRGWWPDGFVQKDGYRIYRYKAAK